VARRRQTLGEPVAPEKASKGSGRRYSTFVGVAFLVLIIVATLNTIRTESGGTLGLSGGHRGMPLSEFAVPNALTGPLDRDANIAQDDCSTSDNPCPVGDERPSACEIPLPRSQAIRVCDLFNRPLVLSFWFTRGADCLPTQDALDEIARDYRGRVNFLSIDIRDDPADVRSIAQEHGWSIPVGYDRDGAVSDLYRVGVCPTVAFAYPGGILAFAKAGTEELSRPRGHNDVASLRAGLRADTNRLVRQSRTREEENR
jgi:thiol-disulfide isomerase/thioredoxin